MEKYKCNHIIDQNIIRNIRLAFNEGIGYYLCKDCFHKYTLLETNKQVDNFFNKIKGE